MQCSLFKTSSSFPVLYPTYSSKRVTSVIVLITALFSNFVKAQDTIRLSITEAEEQFVKNNFLLLAQKFQVDKQSALLIQAKTLQNPKITANFNLYDPENDILFHDGKTGQKDFLLEQLIQLGGKRRISIEKAALNKEVAISQLSDLLRELRLSLHETYYSVYREYSYIIKYNNQLQLLDTIIQTYSKQAAIGNVSAKDVVRLKSTYLKLSSEKSESLEKMNLGIAQLRLITGLKEIIIPKITENSLDLFTKTSSVSELENLAILNRPDLQMQDQSLRSAALDLSYQQRNRIPDAVFNVATDQRGGAFRNQVNFGVSIDLPVLNQNRGGILAAKSDMQSASSLLDQKKLQLQSEVLEAYLNMVRSISEYQTIKALFDADFDNMLKNVSDNFSRRNLSILEFVDFLESYSDGIKELARIRSQIAISAAKINYVTGSKIY